MEVEAYFFIVWFLGGLISYALMLWIFRESEEYIELEMVALSMVFGILLLIAVIGLFYVWPKVSQWKIKMPKPRNPFYEGERHDQ